MVDVYMPEQKSSLSKFMGLFQQGMGLLQAGKGGKEAWDSFTGSSSSGSGGGIGGAAAGGAAGKYGLGLEFGNVTAAEGAPAAAEAGGALETVGSIAPYAAPVVAGVGTYQDYKKTGGQNVGPIGTSPRAQEARWGMAENTMKAGRDINAEANRFGKSIGLGLTEQTGPSLDAIERRLSSQQNAQRDIDAARDALNVAGLPPDERRAIAQKLDRARQQLIGGRKRGSTLYT